MRRLPLPWTLLAALATLVPQAAAAQALLPPPRGANQWAVFREGDAPAACYVCRLSPRPKDCPGVELPRTGSPERCDAFATGRDLLRRGECTKVALREFTVGDCGPR
jgi:hypothetical protein